MKSISLTESEINHIKEMYSQELERLQKRTAEISAMLKKIETQEYSQLQTSKIKSEKTVEKVEKVLKSTKKAKPVSAKKKEKATDLKVAKKRGRPAKEKAEVAVIAPLKVKEVAAPKAKRGRKPKTKVTAKNQPVAASETAKPKDITKAKAVAKPKKIAAKPKKETKVVKKKAEKSKKSHWTTSILDLLDKAGKVMTSRQIIDQIMVIQKIADVDRPKTRSIVTGSLSDLKLETKRIKSTAVPGQKGELYGLAQWYDDAGNLLEKFKN
jgi:hypothetical protein